MWEKKVLTYCEDDYGTYENFEEAQEACKKEIIKHNRKDKYASTRKASTNQGIL